MISATAADLGIQSGDDTNDVGSDGNQVLEGRSGIVWSTRKNNPDVLVQLDHLRVIHTHFEKPRVSASLRNGNLSKANSCSFN